MPSKILMIFGLLSVVLSALFLWRQRDIKRLMAYSSISQASPGSRTVVVSICSTMAGPASRLPGSSFPRSYTGHFRNPNSVLKKTSRSPTSAGSDDSPSTSDLTNSRRSASPTAGT